MRRYEISVLVKYICGLLDYSPRPITIAISGPRPRVHLVKDDTPERERRLVESNPRWLVGVFCSGPDCDSSTIESAVLARLAEIDAERSAARA